MNFYTNPKGTGKGSPTFKLQRRKKRDEGKSSSGGKIYEMNSEKKSYFVPIKIAEQRKQ